MNTYNDLLKIKKPVLIEVYSLYNKRRVVKYRILYPNGRCEYVYVDNVLFQRSCFSKNDLKKTVKAMISWDLPNRKIKIKEL